MTFGANMIDLERHAGFFWTMTVFAPFRRSLAHAFT
jgi:hypothetical protein